MPPATRLLACGRMRPADLALLRLPSHVSATPDGRLACYALARPDLDANAYRSQVWVVPTDGSAPPRQLTRGPRDTAPVLSPDGRWLAFLRATDDQAKPQLHVMPLDGGEPRQVCEHPLGADAPTWSPDGTRLAYAARVPEPGRYGTDPDVRADQEPPRRITTRKYRWDGVGYTIDRRPHIFVVDAHAEDAEPAQITDGDFDDTMPTWSPDSRRIAFVSARHADRDVDLASDVFVVDAVGGTPERLTDTRHPVLHPAFAGDGSWLAYLGIGADPVDVAGRTTGLWRVPADGSQPPRRLSDPAAHDLRNLFARSPSRPIVTAQGIVTARLHRGAVELVRFPLDGGAPTALLSGPRQVVAAAPAGERWVAVVADDTCAGEVVAVDPDGTERTLTDHGGELARTVALRPLTELHARADDGYPVHGWVVRPAGSGPFPVLLVIHGGPHAQFGWTLFDEAQVYAGAGYAVVLGNPRGSQGYGEQHGRAVVGAVGDRDRADLEALLDAALADPDLDAERVGVMGGSYGGLMTTLLAAVTDRFTAGISERSLNALDSFAGSSDIGSFFPDLYFGAPSSWAPQSPLTHAGGITCPMLLIHAEQDYRCPLEQAQRLFERLCDQGVPAELLVFPGEGHELSRSGQPRHRLQRFEAILEWWSHHLG